MVFWTTSWRIEALARGLVGGLAALGALLSALSLAPLARANGRMPGATELSIARSDRQHLLARATFGLVQSFDGGDSWQWICEQAINVSGESDPPLALTEDGSLILLPTVGATLISRDKGCTWSIAPELADSKAIDLTVDPTDPSHVLVVTSTIDAIDAMGLVTYINVVFETRDNAASWQVVATLASDFEIETLEVAPSDPRRIYVSGTSNESPLIGVIERTDDAGGNWQRTTLDLPPSSGSLFVSAVDPNNPDRLWVRVPAQGDRFGLFPASLLISSDAGESFEMVGATAQGMLGFALSPDGTELAYGGPFDGLFVGPSDGSAPIEKVSDLRVRCLRWNADGLYACGLEPQDPFSVGLSTDKGASFQPIYKMADTCPQECADATSFAAACQQPWTGISMRIAPDAADCTLPWPSVMPDAGSDGDAGSTDAGSTDAGAERDGAQEDAATAPVERPGSDGCSCHAVGAGRDRGKLLGMSALVLGFSLVRLRRRRRKRIAAACALLVALIGCGDDAANAEPPVNEADAGAMFVACPDTIPDFESGLAVLGDQGHIQAVLLDASDFPARKYANEWTLELTDESGDVLDDVTVTNVETFMPVHGHYGRPPANFDPLEQPEQLRAEIHFTMRGPWEVRIKASSPSAGDDLIVFDVCVYE
jgi:photosystem II stability/assembly factor-like uncharacterized protein